VNGTMTANNFHFSLTRFSGHHAARVKLGKLRAQDAAQKNICASHPIFQIFGDFSKKTIAPQSNLPADPTDARKMEGQIKEGSQERTGREWSGRKIDWQKKCRPASTRRHSSKTKSSLVAIAKRDQRPHLFMALQNSGRLCNNDEFLPPGTTEHR
jgi:hypothetical protein